MSRNRGNVVRSFAVGLLMASLVLAAESSPGQTASPSGKVEPARVVVDAKSGEAALSNGLVRVRFHPAAPGKFGLFPRGYTGYTLDIKQAGAWTPMATAKYFTSYVYRSAWGRDWLHYVIPKKVEVRNAPAEAAIVFSESQVDLDGVTWSFTFAFTLRPDRPVVEVNYSASPSARRELLLFWGPRLSVGEGTFGKAKDEALFPGLEYLGKEERSSANPAIAPDARMFFTPHPRKVTIPLMAVVHQGRMAGLMWDWRPSPDEGAGPTPLFASPNWLEGKDNHLLGVFAPGIPNYVPENGLRAHTPMPVEAGKQVSIQARMFACQAAHAVDAVDLYLAEHGGVPAPAAPPMDRAAALELLVRGATSTSWDAPKKGWRRLFGMDTCALTTSIVDLYESATLVSDPKLAQQARRAADEALSVQEGRTLDLALRVGGLPRVLDALEKTAAERMRSQQPDGSWIYTESELAEGGLAGLYAPPDPKVIAPTGTKSQGITASRLADLMDYVLVSGDEVALKAAMRGLADLDRYAIPYAIYNDECPPSPSLHGSYLGLRCYLAAYRLTGEKRFLERAVYWAKTGLPFVYLWSAGPQPVGSGCINGVKRLYPKGEALFQNPRRDPMLYGALYGYGSSQYMHHWYGLLVQWIGLVYAQDITELARYDSTLPWKRIAEGIVTSCLWQTADRAPYTGYWPDAFSVETWVPSGPWMSPEALLDTFLPCMCGRRLAADTVVLRAGTQRAHLTSVATIGQPTFAGNSVRFTLDAPGWPCCRAVVAPVREPSVVVDGRKLAKTDDLEKAEEAFAAFPHGLVLLKLRQTGQARVVEVSGF